MSKIKIFLFKVYFFLKAEILGFLFVMIMLGMVMAIWSIFLYIDALLFKDFSYIFAFFSGAFSLALVEILIDYLGEKLRKWGLRVKLAIFA